MKGWHGLTGDIQFPGLGNLQKGQSDRGNKIQIQEKEDINIMIRTNLYLHHLK